MTFDALYISTERLRDAACSYVTALRDGDPEALATARLLERADKTLTLASPVHAAELLGDILTSSRHYGPPEIASLLMEWAEQLSDWPGTAATSPAARQLRLFLSEHLAGQFIEQSSLGTKTARLLRGRSNRHDAAMAVRRSLDPAIDRHDPDDDLSYRHVTSFGTDPRPFEPGNPATAGWDPSGPSAVKLADNTSVARLSDGELVGMAARADSTTRERETAFGEIYQRYSADILSFCTGWVMDPDTAQDVAQDTFYAAFTDLAGSRALRAPDKLRAWLLSIARNRSRECWRRQSRHQALPFEWQDSPDEEDITADGDRVGFSKIGEDSEDSTERIRRAQVDSLLDIVVATFTPREQRVYEAAVTTGLSGSQLARHLGITARQAADYTYEMIATAREGFGALVLARDGRKYCPGLAQILDDHGWTGKNFTRHLRLRILRHLSACATGDNCYECNRVQNRIIAIYAP